MRPQSGRCGLAGYASLVLHTCLPPGRWHHSLLLPLYANHKCQLIPADCQSENSRHPAAKRERWLHSPALQEAACCHADPLLAPIMPCGILQPIYTASEQCTHGKALSLLICHPNRAAAIGNACSVAALAGSHLAAAKMPGTREQEWHDTKQPPSPGNAKAKRGEPLQRGHSMLWATSAITGMHCHSVHQCNG